MPNHIHALVQTPLPNLASGMQHWLSGYANWYAKRNQRTGHLFQGRYKALLVEEGGYYWTLSQYIHLNCVNGTRPLVDHPVSWPHSSYPGYCRKSIQDPTSLVGLRQRRLPEPHDRFGG
jgi:putative transposase